ncbi:MAG: iron ABC transporter permease [Hamadaea sp.]|uniref:FecCD family ABC transporter permease n=1 Tax=Hamadaea sp. TaxID=2024425 RepID=UPI0017F88207|nr:iron ABC transporter permease [Hamadaea sp.]NUR72890.1 iron ABC transporter permease [Hamadaea sp.]NUT22174.1 iron ABC transporter permease [Hamadaea sp.]
MKLRYAGWLVAAGAVLAGAMALSVSVGEADLPWSLALDLRLPRTALAAVSGALFGIGGALIQSVTRNPLASPDVIGVTQGAGLAAVIAVTAGLPYALVAPTALAGGLLAAAVAFLLGARSGFTANRFVLGGVAIAFALRAGIEITLTTADAIDAQRAQIWLLGSLNGLGWAEATPLAITLVVALPLLAMAAWALRTSALDDDTARGLGARPVGVRAAAGALGVVMAALATATVGAVDFVALVAPQTAQRLARTERPPIALAGVVGAALVVVADLVARRLLAPTQLPVGVVTAAIGGPFLIFLLLRARRA